MPKTISKHTRKAVLKTFKGCYAGEDRAGYLKGTEDEAAALQLVEENKLFKSPKNADTGGLGDKRYTYFCPLFDTFDYERSGEDDYGNKIVIPVDERMKNWK